MSFEAECNSELTLIVPAYQLHFRFPVQNKIHKQNFLSDTRTGILGSIAGPCDFLPFRSDEFQKVCVCIMLVSENIYIIKCNYQRENLHIIESIYSSVIFVLKLHTKKSSTLHKSFN